MSNEPQNQTTDAPGTWLDETAWTEACEAAIQTARVLKPKLMERDKAAIEEFGRVCGDGMAKAGATEAEARLYTCRILLMVLGEPQA